MGKRVALLAAALAVLVAGEASATGNIKPGVGIHATTLSMMDCSWDTSISVTASTLDTLVAPCWARFVTIQSQTASMAFSSRVIGANNTVNVYSNKLGSGWKVVDSDLTLWTVATGELFAKAYTSGPTKLIKGVIIDGASTGSIYISFEP